MSVSLRKSIPSDVRVPVHGASYDLYSWGDYLAPLWWDDASYARYQSRTGDEAVAIFELNFRADGRGPVVKSWAYPEEMDGANSSSREDRLNGELIESLRRDNAHFTFITSDAFAQGDDYPF